MQTFLKISVNSLFQFVGRVFSSLTSIIVTALITNNLSREVWGEFVIVISFIALFSLIADFGLNGYVLKIFTSDQESIEKNFKDILGLRLVLALVAIITGLAVLAFVPHSFAVKIGIIVGLLMIFFQSIFSTAAIIFQYKLRYDLYAVSDIIGSLTILLLVGLAVIVKAPLLVIVSIFVIGNLIKAVFGLFLAKSLVRFEGVSFDAVSFRKLLIASLPLGLMIVFAQINNNIDKQIIALTNPKTLGVSATVAVGIYGLAYRLFDFLVSIPTFIVNSAYPVLLNKFKSDRKDLLRFSQWLLGIMIALGAFFAIVGWIIAPVLINLFGPYKESVTPTRILFLGLPIFFATSFLVWLVVTLNREITLPFVFGFAALFNLVMNLVLIPKFGYIAAAWVTVATEITILVLLIFILGAYFRQDKNVKKLA